MESQLDHILAADDPSADRLDAARAAQAFAALGSEARLAIVLTLVRAGPEGLPVGIVQSRTGIAPSTLSHHIKFLSAAGLVSQERQGRALICRAALTSIEALAAFLTEECCRDVCAPGAPDVEPAADPVIRKDAP